jgi:hypothetical protein
MAAKKVGVEFTIVIILLQRLNTMKATGFGGTITATFSENTRERKKNNKTRAILTTTMAEKRTRDVMEGLELKVLEQHNRYGPAPSPAPERRVGISLLLVKVA